MSIKTRCLVIAMMLTATAGMASVAAAGTASASATAPQASCSTVEIMNPVADEWWTGGEAAYAYYVLEAASSAYAFCPEYQVTNGGVAYYYYQDSIGLCMTADLKHNDVDEETCGAHPASQEWHYYYDSVAKDGTLENYYTGDCAWAEGQPPAAGSVITEGGCTRNQNNTFIEEP